LDWSAINNILKRDLILLLPNQYSSEDALVGGGIFSNYFQSKIPLYPSNPGTKLAPGRALRIPPVAGFSEGARLPR